MLLAPLATQIYPKHPKLPCGGLWRLWRPWRTCNKIGWSEGSCFDLNLSVTAGTRFEKQIPSQMSQISFSELCGPLMLLAVGFEYVPHSCFQVSKTINMCTYHSCLLDHPSRDSYLMWTSHTQQVVSLAQTSPWCFLFPSLWSPWIAKELELQEPLRNEHQLFMCFQAVVELLRHSLERFRVTAASNCLSNCDLWRSLWQFRQVVKHREFQGFLLQTLRKPGALLESSGPKSCASASVLADCLLRNPPKWDWFLQFDSVPRRFTKANPCAQRQKTMMLCNSSASLRWDHPAKSLIAL